MKKMLVLALVLAVAGLANAGLSMVYAVDKLVVSSDIGLVGGINPIVGVIGTPWVAEDGTLPAGIALRTTGAPAAAPEWQAILSGASSVAGELPYDGGTVVLFWGDPTLAENPAGVWMTIDFAGYVLGTENAFDVQVDLVDQIAGTTSSVYLMNAIPEPMTMGLLGLGALFLRKRK